MEALILVLIVLAAYFAPTIIASTRQHPQHGSIFVINFLLGWTFIGWVVALAMSVSHISPQRN